MPKKAAVKLHRKLTILAKVGTMVKAVTGEVNNGTNLQGLRLFTLE